MYRSLYQSAVERCIPKMARAGGGAGLERLHVSSDKSGGALAEGGRATDGQRNATAAHVSLLMSWATFELRQGRLPQVQVLLTRVRLFDGSSGELHHLQALLLIKLNQRADARAILEQGLLVAPRHVPLYKLLGSLQASDNDVEAARISFERGLQIQPDYAQIYHAWARLEARLLNWQALAELNRRALAAFPPDRQPSLGVDAEG